MEDSALPQAPEPESADRIVRDYFSRIRKILLESRSFFAAIPLTGSLSGPLAFALVTHWIAAAIEFVISRVLGTGVHALSQRILSFNLGDDIDTPARTELITRLKVQLAEWLSSSALVITAPFWTLLWLLGGAWVIWLASRLLSRQPAGSPRASYGSAVRILCYSTTPVLLSPLPLVGGLIASIYSIVLTVIGAREVYQVSTERAIVIALFPRILAVVSAVVVVLMLLLVFAGLLIRLT